MSRWTEERVEFAKKRWKEGGSGAEIAAELGEGFTKNSVICKMFRLGLSFQGGSRDGRSASDRSTRSRADKPSLPGRARSAVKAQAKAVDRAAKEARTASVRSSRSTLEHLPLTAPQMPPTGHYGAEAVHALVEGACKWPVGDPLDKDFRFCGCQSQSGHVYCQYHTRMAYVPSKSRPVSDSFPLRRIA